MFLPIGDSPNPRGTPFVTYALIAANVAVYLFVTLPASFTAPDPSDPAVVAYAELIARLSGLSPQDVFAQMSAYDGIVFRWAFRPAEPSVATLFSSMFMHAGLMHLFGNMLFLWIYGDNVEHRLGRFGYLAAYLATGFCATSFHYLFDQSSDIPMLGASGAVSGVLGFYFLFFPRNTVRVFIFLFPFLMNVFTIRARIVLGIYLLVDNLLPFLLSGAGGSGVAHGAHIGGFAGGLIAAWLVDQRERLARPRDPDLRTSRQEARAEVDPAQRIEDLVRTRRHSEAASLYFASPDTLDRRLDPGILLELAGWLAESGHAKAGLSLFRRVLHHNPRGIVGARAHLGAGVVQLRDLDRPTAAYQHFLDVIDLAPESTEAGSARSGLRAIEERARRD